MADHPSEMKEELEVLYRYTQRKGMSINGDKCKIMIFSAGGNGSTEEWKCGPHTMEEVKSFPYLGFTFQATERYIKHKDVSVEREEAYKYVLEYWTT